MDEPNQKSLEERIRSIFWLGAITTLVSCISLFFVNLFAGTFWGMLAVVYLAFGVIGSYATSKMAQKEIADISKDYDKNG